MGGTSGDDPDLVGVKELLRRRAAGVSPAPPAPDEESTLREETLRNLSKTGIVPATLLAAIAASEHRALLSWTRRETDSGSEADEWTWHITQEASGTTAQDPDLPSTVGELFAIYLLALLQKLRQAELSHRKGTSSRTPVRDDQLTARTVIADAAMLITKAGEPLGRYQVQLLCMLLDTDRRKASSREIDARYLAAWYLAMDAGVRVVAEIVGVAPSSISRWQRDLEFRTRVQEYRRILAGLSALNEEAVERRKARREKVAKAPRTAQRRGLMKRVT